MPYTPKKPGQTYTVDAEGNEKILTEKQAEAAEKKADAAGEKTARSGKSG